MSLISVLTCGELPHRQGRGWCRQFAHGPQRGVPDIGSGARVPVRNPPDEGVHQGRETLHERLRRPPLSAPYGPEKSAFTVVVIARHAVIRKFLRVYEMASGVRERMPNTRA
ncbi:hypothetical protein OHB56_32220 [Streptomyces sp. NBC_01635]|uniref:Transposase n=1 Tax=Streptomyces hirsutus TaxID=35620 RepID=A0ABZ1GWS8_9ACTN|nr:hypothetical protein [Streptomyces hirsutus]WSD09640.1 hypothetical protein OIE73_30465 [Streptomyces hirsutus]WTD78116.1 hypothetical protein OHB56_32220 [Streptomyces sp. NBC_01635]